MTTRRLARTIQARPEPRMSTTLSQRRRAATAQSSGQCSDQRRLSSTMTRSQFGMRANSSAATGPQTTVMRQSG